MPRQGLEQATYLREETFPIRPILGAWSLDSGSQVPPGASPDMLNCQVLSGVLRKRPGFTQYQSGNASIGGPVSGLYSTQDTQDNTHLVAAWRAGLAKYNTATNSWDACTGPALTGADSQIFSFETSQNRIVFSQGVDRIQSLDPITGTVYAVLNANAPPAKYLTRFNSRLNAVYTVESGDTKPFRHRRPVSGDHTDWTGLGSGFRDCAEFPYHVKGVRKIGTQLALYYEKAIEICTAQPNASAPFRYDTQVADVGLYAPHTLKGRNDVHFFLGNDNFYSFNGVQIAPIGDPIRDMVFRVLNATNLHRMFAEILFDTQEYLAFLCTGANYTPDTAWVFNWSRSIWYPWSVSGHTCSCVHRLDDTVTIDELIGTIDAQNWEFDSRIIQQAYPALLTGNVDGKIYIWSPQYASDAGTSISCRWTSHDLTSENVFQVRGRKISLKRITIEYQMLGAQSTLNFYLSNDGGNTWQGPYPVTMLVGSGYATVTVDKIITGDRVRFKFTQDSASESFAIVEFKCLCMLHDTQEYAAA